MHRSPHNYLWRLPLLLALLAPHAVMGQFGSAVAVDKGSVFVMKPGGPFNGSASIHLYSRSNGSWTLKEVIYPDLNADTGQMLTPSLTIREGRLYAGAGDPSGRLAAHQFFREGESWRSDGWIELSPENQTSAPSSVTLTDIFRVIQPPSRVLASAQNLLAVGVSTENVETSGVHIFSVSPSIWERVATLSAPVEPSSGFGAGVSITPEYLLVGAPQSDSTGEAYVYARKEADNWIHAASLSDDGLPADARFGAAVHIDGTTIIVGAPGNGNTGAPGTVLDFSTSPGDSTWRQSQRLSAPNALPDDRFGATLAMINDELWIGAPNVNDARGAVYRYVREEPGMPWTIAGALEIENLGPRTLFGSTIAGAGDVAVIGMPGADNGYGIAVIFDRDESGSWKETTRVSGRETLRAIAGEEIRCEEGQASGFSCDNVDLMAFLPMSALGATSREQVSDLWGWTDPLNGHEYALIGRNSGASIVDVTNPVQPVYLGLVTANPTPVRDLKIYQDHLFFTGDGAGDHGLVVFDLTRLRSVSSPPAVFEPDAVYHGFASAHNLIIDMESGFAYAVGASQGGETCGGGLHMVDIRDPLNPSFAGCYIDTIGLFSAGRTHDGQCTVYHGLDERYFGRQICFLSNETALRIVDVTDKSNPQPIAAARYPRTAYVHQGWLTEDHRYFYLDDELDELVGMTDRTRTMIWDLSELDDPILAGEVKGATGATDHNLYVKGDRMYQANYQAGMSVWDISNPLQPTQIGHFDTSLASGDPPGFVGAWTTFPYFESGTVIVSSIHEGLFVVRPREIRVTP